MRSRALLVSIGLIATSFAVSGPPVQASGTPELAHVTYLTGSHAGGIDVHLDKKARIRNPLYSGDSVQVSAPGNGFAGFALVATDVPKNEGFVAIGGRFPDDAGERSFIDVGGDWFAIGRVNAISLAPGDYTLYLLPGSGRTTVKLTFEGLEGSTRLERTTSTDYEHEAQSNASGIPVPNYHYTSTVGRLGGRGLLFTSSWLTAPAHAVADADICFWRNEPRDPDSRLPNCGSTEITEPGNLWGSSGTVSYGPEAGEVFKAFSGSWHPFSSGFDKPRLRYGASTTIETVVPPTSTGSFTFWLTY